jgi:pteridine reductase
MKRKRDAVLITGGTKRLGQAFARHSLSMGLSVVAHFHSTMEPLATWLRRHASLRSRVHFVQADLTDNPAELVRLALQCPVSLVGLVNNASLFTRGTFADQVHFDKTLAVNVQAPLRLAQCFQREVGRGWIINITDAHVPPTSGQYQNYRLSKRLLADMTRHLALAFAPSVRVNAIAPGPVLPPEGESAEYLRTIAAAVPLGAITSIDCLLKAFTYLVENRCVTGQVLYVDGGWHLKG